MSPKDRAHLRPLLFLAVLMLLAAVAVEVGMTRPQRLELDRIAGERQRLMEELQDHQNHLRQGDELAAYLEVGNLVDLLEGVGDGDAVSYLNGKLAEAKLTQLELITEASSAYGKLHRSQFSLRLTGRYAGVLQFVRSLEQDRRLATIDAFVITEIEGSSQIEGRFNISIYDTGRGQ